jgi:hypothetical protein
LVCMAWCHIQNTSIVSDHAVFALAARSNPTRFVFTGNA